MSSIISVKAELKLWLSIFSPWSSKRKILFESNKGEIKHANLLLLFFDYLGVKLENVGSIFSSCNPSILVNESQRQALSGQGFAVEHGFGYDSNLF